MLTELIIRLKKANAVVTPRPVTVATATSPAVPAGENIDWVPALIAAANEIQTLNKFSGTVSFPRPIPSNPNAMTRVTKLDGTFGPWTGTVESFLGLVNTPPDSEGFVTVRIDYEYLDLSFLPAQPNTFTFVFGRPSTAGAIA